MVRILDGQEAVVNMIDDVLVFGRNKEEHDVRGQQALSRLEEAEVTLNSSKCKFSVSEVPFLGVFVSPEGIKPDPAKLEALRLMEPPEDVAVVRRPLGMVNHLARFLPHISDVTAPLRIILNKNTAWTWQHDQEAAFERVKELVTSDRCMAKYHPTFPTTISTDASSFGLGAVLFQVQASGEGRTLGFASRSMTSVEQRYSQTEKEALALRGAVQRFDEFVRRIKF